MKVKGSKKQYIEDVLENRSLFDRFYDITAILDIDGNFLYANKAFFTFSETDKTLINHSKPLRDAFQIIDENNAQVDPISDCKNKLKYLGIREIKAVLSDKKELSIQLGIQPLFSKENEDELKGFLVNIQDKSLEYNLHVKYRDVIDKIEQDFNESVRIFANITDMVDSKSDVSVKMSNMAYKIASQLNLSEKEIREISVAARLRSIGTLGMNPEMLEKDLEHMTTLEKEEYEKYPILGSLIFDGIPAFENICSYISGHREHYDGKGFPLKLSKDDIPIGASILGLLHDYCATDVDEDNEAEVRKRIQSIQDYSEIKYHPIVVDAFLEVMSDKSSFRQKMERKDVQLSDLKIGMRLASNLHSSKGILLMQTDERITAAALKKIHRFHENDPITQKIQIFQAIDSSELTERINVEKQEENKKANVKKQVLVVDDTQDLNMLICMMLNKSGRYIAEGVHNGPEALVKIKEEEYDLFIFDIMMPGMSGIELLDQIRTEGNTTPVIMCTAKSDSTDVIDAFKKGADDYLIKPVLMKPLLEGADKVLDYQSAEGETDFNAYRKKQMVEVLKVAAPEVLLKGNSDKPLYDVQFKFTHSMKTKPYIAPALNLSKSGFTLQYEENLDSNARIAFSLTKRGENKALIVGMAKITGPGDKENSYTVAFINVRKP